MRSFDTLSVLACLPSACLEMQLKIKTAVARSQKCPRRLVCEDAVISGIVCGALGTCASESETGLAGCSEDSGGWRHRGCGFVYGILREADGSV